MPSRVASKTYGTVAADRRKEMSGLQFVRGLVEGSLPLNTIARTLGYEVTEVSDGRVVVTAKPGEAHLNPAGTVHGGFAATLLDSCMGLAVWSTLEKGLGQTTLEFKERDILARLAADVDALLEGDRYTRRTAVRSSRRT